ncbi:S1C family serine protease [Citricoccus sp.]|uniref:S1C family serine protease n=1 Tax=Citricoccus sp. TaxID=1978372 RepID=UPI00262F8F37|nr:trypsin-like peptidase domain-containing protein [Citricoccus sp.]HRO30297.1 trypsin-like peptidase domain-containing protein [Citricoccus sp.]HRO93085.1 trypsin-like peptidase domain-containing protein [Citricoccus sp.]
MNDADHHGPQSGAGREAGGSVPPRPESPPSGPRGDDVHEVSASRDPYPRWDETQAMPAYGAAPGSGHPAEPGPAAYGPGPQGGPGDQGARGDRPDRLGGARRTVGVGTLVAGMLLAGLAGGGVAAGVNAAADTADTAAGTTQQQDGGTVREQGHGLDINRTEDATLVTAAAAKAAPSVVTLSVTDGQSAGSGSGVILDDQGHILTNTHVVTMGGASGDADITVQTADGTVHTAEVVGTDPESDLAVVKIDAEGLTPMELGESSTLNVGDAAIAIGAPLGLSGTVTDGIVSKLNRTISVSSSAPQDGGEGGAEGAPEFRIPGLPDQQQSKGSIFINVIQTDAAINPGNSGGALIDAEGRLIGINVAIASAAGGAGEGAGNIGVGFSIPVDYAQRIAQDLIRNGEATHGFLGVSVTPQPATPAGADGAQASGVSDADQAALASGGFSAGARVVDVVSGSPAEEAGLTKDDVITGVGDRPVTDSQSLTAVVREYPEGGTATVHFMRDGQEQSAEVTFVSGAEQQ